MKLFGVGLKILPFTFFDYFQESLRLAILRDSLRIPRQTLVVFALVTLDCLKVFGHFSSLQINRYDMVIALLTPLSQKLSAFLANVNSAPERG
jgi:hypothetical protein